MRTEQLGIVAGLTAAALAAVGFLAYQASAHRPGRTSRRPAATARTAPSERHSDRRRTEEQGTRSALPAGSGTGVRVVYSLDAERVWLVGADGQGHAHVHGRRRAR